MRLSKIAYYADFVIYPSLIVAASATTVDIVGEHRIPAYVGAFVAGCCGWTLIEYVLHRFVFHHAPYFEPLHDMHHREPLALIGTPIWASLPFLLVTGFLPLLALFGPVVAVAATCGIAAGYVWYALIHHAVHHWKIERGSWLYETKRRHQLHHHADNATSFGVTTGFWDRVFQSVIIPRRLRPGGHSA